MIKAAFALTHQGSNLESSGPKPDVFPLHHGSKYVVF